jgi:hypothetical protein
MHPRALSGEDLRHVGAQGLGERQQDQKEQRDLKPSVASHERLLELLRAQQRVEQIRADQRRNYQCRYVFHGFS